MESIWLKIYDEKWTRFKKKSSSSFRDVHISIIFNFEMTSPNMIERKDQGLLHCAQKYASRLHCGRKTQWCIFIRPCPVTILWVGVIIITWKKQDYNTNLKSSYRNFNTDIMRAIISHGFYIFNPLFDGQTGLFLKILVRIQEWYIIQCMVRIRTVKTFVDKSY